MQRQHAGRTITNRGTITQTLTFQDLAAMTAWTQAEEQRKAERRIAWKQDQPVNYDKICGGCMTEADEMYTLEGWDTKKRCLPCAEKERELAAATREDVGSQNAQG